MTYLFRFTTQGRLSREDSPRNRFEGIFPCITLAKNSDKNQNIDVRDSTAECSEIESLSITTNNESTGVTTFVEEACTAVDAMGSYYRSSKAVHPQNDLQDLSHYFSRPRIIAAGAIPDTRSVFNAINVSTDLMDAFIPQFKNRLTGVAGVRFSIVFTLQAAASAFHQGLINMSFQYGVAHSGITSTYDSGAYIRGGQPATCTNLPSVRLDLSTGTMIQLKVPFLSDLEYLSLTTSNKYGVLHLVNLAPCPVLASASAPLYKLMIHLEDLEYFGARPHATSAITLQSGRVMNTETEDEGKPFSSGLYSASNTLKWIAKGIPSLASFAAPTSWALGKAAGVVRYFGYSKPTVQEPCARMLQYSTAMENNVDVPSNALVAGPFASNRLKIDHSIANSLVDEMSLKYVLSRYSQTAFSQIGANFPSGTILYSTRVSPSYLWYRQNIGSGGIAQIPPKSIAGAGFNSFMPTHLFYWASMFRYWRGTIKFRFTIVKTKMHGGRVMACYNPSQTATVQYSTVGVPGEGPAVETLPAGGSAPQPNGYTKIFDLRDGNVFDFDVPYVSNMPYSRFLEDVGTFTLTLLDSLQTTPTVSNIVHFMVEVAAGDDFELNVPAGVRYPVVPNSPGIRLQSGQVMSTVTEDISEVTVGENITSAKQLIMIPSQILASITYPTQGNAALSFPPWYWQPAFSTTFPVKAAPRCSFGYAGNIASCYLFARGSTDVHVYTDEGGFIVGNYASSDYNAGNTAENTVFNGFSSCIPKVVNRGRATHLRFPAYNRLSRIKTHVLNTLAWAVNEAFRVQTTTGASAAFYDKPVVVPRVNFISSTGDAAGPFAAILGRAAGDDAILGHYMGPPPLYIPTELVADAVYDPDGSSVVASNPPPW